MVPAAVRGTSVCVHVGVSVPRVSAVGVGGGGADSAVAVVLAGGGGSDVDGGAGGGRGGGGCDSVGVVSGLVAGLGAWSRSQRWWRRCRL